METFQKEASLEMRYRADSLLFFFAVLALFCGKEKDITADFADFADIFAGVFSSASSALSAVKNV